MGRESRCPVCHDGERAEARALLETDELIVRAPFRLGVPRREITSARAEGATLIVEWRGGSVELELGEREAQRWANEIVHPRTLADKLGVKAGQRLLLVGALDYAELVGAGTRVEQGPADVVFVAIDAAADLDRIASLRGEIAGDGAIWTVRRKGQSDVTEAMVIAAGRAAGLTDIKIARISDSHTGMKFVIPLAER